LQVIFFESFLKWIKKNGKFIIYNFIQLFEFQSPTASLEDLQSAGNISNKEFFILNN
jgi:hypothetical protein